MNRIRLNAGLARLTSVELPSQEKLRQAIRKERRIELAFEAKRYFDLNRWGLLEGAIQKQMDFLGLTFPKNKLIDHPITKKKYYLNPIPSIEFTNNAKLETQNPGY